MTTYRQQLDELEREQQRQFEQREAERKAASADTAPNETVPTLEQRKASAEAQVTKSPAPGVSPPSQETVNAFAIEQGISKEQAFSTITRYQRNPQSGEFKALLPQQIASLKAASEHGSIIKVAPQAFEEGRPELRRIIALPRDQVYEDTVSALLKNQMPSNAVVTSRDVNGKPLTITVDGRTFFTPYSVDFKRGYYTEDERVNVKYTRVLDKDSPTGVRVVRTGGQAGRESGQPAPHVGISNFTPELVGLSKADYARIADLTPYEQFKELVDAGYIAKGAIYLGNTTGKNASIGDKYVNWDFISSYELERVADLKMAKGAGVRRAKDSVFNEAAAITQAYAPSHETVSRKIDTRILDAKDMSRNRAEANLRSQEAIRQKQLERAEVALTNLNKNYTQLPDGQLIQTAELDAMKRTNPKLAAIMTEKGFDAYEKALNDAENTLAKYKKGDKYDIAEAMLDLNNRDKNTVAVELLFDDETVKDTQSRILPQLTLGKDVEKGRVVESKLSKNMIAQLYRYVTPWEEEKGETFKSSVRGVRTSALTTGERVLSRVLNEKERAMVDTEVSNLRASWGKTGDKVNTQIDKLQAAATEVKNNPQLKKQLNQQVAQWKELDNRIEKAWETRPIQADARQRKILAESGEGIAELWRDRPRLTEKQVNDAKKEVRDIKTEIVKLSNRMDASVYKLRSNPIVKKTFEIEANIGKTVKDTFNDPRLKAQAADQKKQWNTIATKAKAEIIEQVTTAGNKAVPVPESEVKRLTEKYPQLKERILKETEQLGAEAAKPASRAQTIATVLKSSRPSPSPSSLVPVAVALAVLGVDAIVAKKIIDSRAKPEQIVLVDESGKAATLAEISLKKPDLTLKPDARNQAKEIIDAWAKTGTANTRPPMVPESGVVDKVQQQEKAFIPVFTLRPPEVAIIQDPQSLPGEVTDTYMTASAAVKSSENRLKQATATIPIDWNKVLEAAERETKRQKIAGAFEVVDDAFRRYRVPTDTRKKYHDALNDYIRRRMILEAAKHSYIASLDPTPVSSSRLSEQATAALAAFAAGKAKGKIVLGKATLTGEAVSTQAATATAISTATNSATASKTATKTSTATATATQTATKTATKQATATRTASATRTATRVKTAELTKTVENTRTRTKIKPFPLKGGGGDAEKREELKKKKGIVAYRRGQLAGKSVWHVHYEPYGPTDKTIVLGKAPAGAKIVTGKGSANASASVLQGRGPTRAIVKDTGAVDDTIVRTRSGISVISKRDPTARRPKKPSNTSTGYNSIKRNRQFYTNIGGRVAISRMPLNRRKR